MCFRLALAIFALLIFCTTPTLAQRVNYPEVSFEYSPIFDVPCAELTKQPIESEAITELNSRLDLFRKSWREEAPQLFKTTVKLTEVPFQFRETRAALSLCRGFPSMSNPLLINVSFFLAATRGKNVAPMTQFSNLIFHEILHRYVSDRIKALPDKTTPLLTKYRDEPLRVRSHLHLFAIMNEVYRKLERQKDLDAVIAWEQTVKSAPIAKRAREIVDKEGAENLIREFRKNR